jgi:hypothetical protein
MRGLRLKSRGGVTSIRIPPLCRRTCPPALCITKVEVEVEKMACGANQTVTRHHRGTCTVRSLSVKRGPISCGGSYVRDRWWDSKRERANNAHCVAVGATLFVEKRRCVASCGAIRQH